MNKSFLPFLEAIVFLFVVIGVVNVIGLALLDVANLIDLVVVNRCSSQTPWGYCCCCL